MPFPESLTVLKQRLNKTPAYKIVLFLYLCYLSYLFSAPDKKLYYDAAAYWKLSLSFFRDGHFSLFNYHESLRGYLFPAMHLGWRLISDATGIEPIYLTRLNGAAYAAILFGYVIPALWKACNKSHSIQNLQVLLLGLFGFVFWRGYFHYPLTDFPSLLLIATGLLFLFKAPRFVNAFIAGLCIAAAINLRPIYQIILPVFVFGFLFIHYRKGLRSLAAPMLGGIAGFLLICAPQSLINARNFDTKSPFVQSVIIVDQGVKNTYLWHLMVGIGIQKYETNIGKDYPLPQMYFHDPTGKAVLLKHKITDIKTLPEYAFFVLNNPVDFSGRYLRHAFNGLDLQYPEPYIEKAKQYNLFLVLANYTCLFLFLAIVLFRRSAYSKEMFLVLLAVLLPCLAAIPTTMECRFLLPLHLFMYCVICFSFPAAWQWKNFDTPSKVRILGAYFLFLVICLAFSANTQSTLQPEPRLLNIY